MDWWSYPLAVAAVIVVILVVRRWPFRFEITLHRKDDDDEHDDDVGRR